jgi:hypothetical protein
MTDDLIIKYFREDLTEAEEQALSETLLSSTDEAFRLYQHAEAAYRYCVLPEPSQSSGQLPPGFLPGGGFKPGLWFSLILAASLLTWGICRYETSKKETILASIPPVTALSTPASHKSEMAIPEKVFQDQVLPSSKPDKDLVSSDSLVEKSMSPVSLAPAIPTVEAVLPPSVLPDTTPVNVLSQPHSAHSNLEVIVRQRASGQVMVRVLDVQGNPVVLLYQGSLQAGSWIFDWNGILGNGQKAMAGTYQIEVASGKVVQRKKVTIHKK